MIVFIDFTNPVWLISNQILIIDLVSQKSVRSIV